MAEDTRNEKKDPWYEKIKLSDAASIAIIPIVAQVIIFVYEYGFFSVFQIPITLISFKINDLFVVVLGMLSIAASIYYYSDLILSAIKDTSEPYRDKLLRVYGSIIILLFLFFSYGLRFWLEWIPALLVVISFSILEFLLPLLLYKDKGSYREKLMAHAEKRALSEKDKVIKTPLETLLQILGPKIILFFLVLYGIYHLGRAQAMTKMDFIVASTTPETVVLWMGDDRFIIAPFERATKIIEPSFQILMLSENPTIKYSNQKIGPLSFNKNVVSTKQAATSTPTVSFIKPTLTSLPTSTCTLTVTKTGTPTANVQPSALPIRIISPMQ